MAKKKAVKKKASPEELFGEWWDRKGSRKAAKIEKAWLSCTEPNGEDDDDEGTDSWCVNAMMHAGEALEMTWDIASRAFLAGHRGEEWDAGMGLFCDLDSVVEEAYLAGKESVS